MSGLPYTAAEAAELSSRLAELAKAGLPLGPGLRAMANELHHGRLARVLRWMAGRLESGDSFESVLLARGASLPAHVRGLVLAGIRTGRLGEAMEQFVSNERQRADLRRRMWAALAYPLVLLFLLCAMFICFAEWIVPQFVRIFQDFGVKLPALTELVILLWRSRAWIFLVAVLGGVAAALLVGSIYHLAWTQRVFYLIPLLGPMWYWARLAWFARLMRILLEQQIPLPQALELAAVGVDDGYLAGACHRVTHFVQRGLTLSEAIGNARRLPPILKPLVSMGEQTSSVSESFRAATELFESQAEVYARLVHTALVPIALLLILGAVGLVVIGFYLPLLALISNLSGVP